MLKKIINIFLFLTSNKSEYDNVPSTPGAKTILSEMNQIKVILKFLKNSTKNSYFKDIILGI